MYTKNISWQSKIIELEHLYPGLQLRCFHRGSEVSATVLRNEKEIGVCEFGILPDAVRLFQLRFAPDFVGQGAGTSVIQYLRTHTRILRRPYLTLCSSNYAMLRLLQNKFTDAEYTRNFTYPRWTLLSERDLLQENNKLSSSYGQDQIVFTKDFFGNWRTNLPAYILHIEPSGRLWVAHPDVPREPLRSVQFYLPRSYELRIPALYDLGRLGRAE